MRVPLILFLIAACSGLRAVAADLVPVEQFAADFTMTNARLAPDGKHLAFISYLKGEPWLMIMNLETKELARVDPGFTPKGARLQVFSFRWLSDRRLSFPTVSRDGSYHAVSAIDCDGRYHLPFAGPDAKTLFNAKLFATEIIHAFGDKDENVLMLDRNFKGRRSLLYPDVLLVSTRDGSYKTVVENPGDVIHWAVDRDGVVRLGITRQEMRYGAIYRETEAAPWRQLPGFAARFGNVLPLGFDETGQRLVVAAATAEERKGLYYYDPKEGQMGELVAKHARYDVLPEAGFPMVDGISLAGSIRSPLTKAVIGVRYFTEGPQTIWFDSTMAGLQTVVDKVLPKTSNLITSFSRDAKRILILAFSDRDPGKYYLLDRTATKPQLTAVGERIANFPVDRMVPMYPIQYTARDGLLINGYLTLPVGEKKKGLPLVVLPHGGVRARDAWGYNPVVQFLANRGYAVLQMNYRGSAGYGIEFAEKGKREIGRRVQDDIEDGTKWAIEQGFADPQRIGIAGLGFGGYSALFAVANSPGIYRCGISIAGITDWVQILNKQKDSVNKYAYEYWKDWLGDAKSDEAFLASISPVNQAERLTVPVLIAHGREDMPLLPWQGSKLIAAMKKSGSKPETLELPDDILGQPKSEVLEKLLRSIDAFLAKHLSPSAPVGSDPAGQ